MERRDFLRNASIATVAGAGLTGTAAADNETDGGSVTTDDELAIQSSHLIEGIRDEHWAGDPNGDNVPYFRFMCPFDTSKGGYYDDEFALAKAAMDELVNITTSIDGVLIQFYDVYHDDDNDPIYRYTPHRDDLDDILNTSNLTDNSVYVWDCGEVHHAYISDWPDDSEHYNVNYSEPAMTSDTYHPVFDGVNGDGHSNDYPHVRTRVPDSVPGRMAHAAVQSLARTRDGGFWNTWESPPDGSYNPSIEWELGKAVYSHTSWTGTERYFASIGGNPTNNTVLSETDAGSCGGNLPSSGWSSELYYDPDVTYCMADAINDACNYFA